MVHAEISPQPPRVGPASIVVRLTDAAATPVTGAGVELEGNMSHPGMAPVFGETKEISPGSYRGKLELSMAGDWVILLHMKMANGMKLEHEIAVKGVRTN